MEAKEIIEINKVIAEFDGWEYSDDDKDFSPNGYYTKENDVELYGIITFPLGGGEGFRYHKDWNWIMPVVEKIGKELGYRVTIDTSFTRILTDEKPIEFRNLDGSLITTLCAVEEFINWYNLNRKELKIEL